MKVLLVPPKNNYPDLTPSLDILGQGFPYIAGALKEAGHNVFGLNLNPMWCHDSGLLTMVRSLQRVIKVYEPPLIGVGGLSANYAFMKDTLLALKKIAPDIPVVFGGGIVTHDPDYIFTPFDSLG
jgi:anaerobic magnesium-protoporphyrin IX monomethyl ester cyclase